MQEFSSQSHRLHFRFLSNVLRTVIGGLIQVVPAVRKSVLYARLYAQGVASCYQEEGTITQETMYSKPQIKAD